MFELMVASIREEMVRNCLALTIQTDAQRRQVVSVGASIKDEIESVGEILDGYGFSFMDLADASPKAQKTKISCAKVVAVILQDSAILEKLRSQKSLPIRDILAEINVPWKLLERHRRYIIAAAEILDGDFPLLAEYMDTIRKVMVS